MVNSKPSLQDSAPLIKEKLIHYNKINYPAKVIEESKFETLRKDKNGYLFSFHILPTIFSQLCLLTGESLFSCDSVSPIIETLVLIEQKGLANLPREKKSCYGAVYKDCLQPIVYLSSNLASKLCTLSSDLFLYSLSGDLEKIEEIKKEVSDIDKDCWKALEQKVVFPAQNMFKNMEIYDTGLKDFEVHPILVHKNRALYYKNRRISILSQVKKIKSEVRDSISDWPNMMIRKVAIILNPYDYLDFQEFIDPFGERTDFLECFFSDWQKRGMSIYKHESVKPGSFIIFEKGISCLFRLLSSLQKDRPFPKMDFYEAIIIPSVFLGIWCYCIGKNVCLPMHYQEESYEQINFLSLRKTKWYFLYTWNNPKFRESCMKILLILLPILCEILKNRFAGSS